MEFIEGAGDAHAAMEDWNATSALSSFRALHFVYARRGAQKYMPG